MDRVIQRCGVDEQRIEEAVARNVPEQHRDLMRSGMEPNRATQLLEGKMKRFISAHPEMKDAVKRGAARAGNTIVDEVGRERMMPSIQRAREGEDLIVIPTPRIIQH